MQHCRCARGNCLAGVQVIPPQHHPGFAGIRHLVHHQCRIRADGIALRFQLGQALLNLLQSRVLRFVISGQALGLFRTPFFSQQNVLHITRQPNAGRVAVYRRQSQPPYRSATPVILHQSELERASLFHDQFAFQQKHRLVRFAKLRIHCPAGFAVAINRPRDFVFRLRKRGRRPVKHHFSPIQFQLELIEHKIRIFRDIKISPRPLLFHRIIQHGFKSNRSDRLLRPDFHANCIRGLVRVLSMHQDTFVFLDGMTRPAGSLKIIDVKRFPLRGLIQRLDNSRFPLLLLNLE